MLSAKILRLQCRLRNESASLKLNMDWLPLPRQIAQLAKVCAVMSDFGARARWASLSRDIDDAVGGLVISYT